MRFSGVSSCVGLCVCRYIFYFVCVHYVLLCAVDSVRVCLRFHVLQSVSVVVCVRTCACVLIYMVCLCVIVDCV